VGKATVGVGGAGVGRIGVGGGVGAMLKHEDSAKPIKQVRAR
jgi:hypothetical protein